MSFALIPLATVRHFICGTFVGSGTMSYATVDFPLIGAAIWPGVGPLAHGYILHKFSLSEKNMLFCTYNI